MEEALDLSEDKVHVLMNEGMLQLFPKVSVTAVMFSKTRPIIHLSHIQ